VTGVLAGLFGIGGGAIIVPVLYEAYALLGVDESVRMHVSVGTSMAVMIPTGIRSFRAHYVRGSVDMAVFKSWLLPMPIGVASRRRRVHAHAAALFCVGKRACRSARISGKSPCRFAAVP
jgi:hypothetical protein